MSVALTTTVRRAYVDLTHDAAPLPRSLQTADDRPPAKRRRSDDGPFGRQGLKACVPVPGPVLPRLVEAVSCLARDECLVAGVAVQAVEALAGAPPLRVTVDEAEDRSRSPEAAVAADADAVHQLIELPPCHARPQNGSIDDGLSDPEPGIIDVDAVVAAKPHSTPSPSAGRHELPAQDVPRHHIRPRQKAAAPPSGSESKWLRLKTRPYLPAAERALIARGSRHSMPRPRGPVEWPLVYHVDFTSDEVGEIFTHLSKHLAVDHARTVNYLTALCFRHNIASLVGDALPGRSGEDVRNFCSDLMAGQAADPHRIRVLSLDLDAGDLRREDRRASRVPSLLLAREMEGNARFGRMRRFENFENEFRKCHEDGLAVVAEYTNCAGDISAMSWVPDGNVLCGTTAHSDSHNQQYNKPGNLVLCSTSRGALRAFADHRIPRPVVEKGENASEAMRQSQDPWLYSSVVSSDYDELCGRAYTSSFDRTVKVWDVAGDGSSMRCVATWRHGGNVNFVAAARDGSGRVASAADVPTEAVRVYTVRADDVDGSPYRAVSCSRTDADGSANWAYFPATMQWGRAAGTTHLLIVGYSPRGLAVGDGDIPEDKANSGEIMLWDAARGCKVPVLTASTANVFEVAWHPRLPRFIVATSPCGLSSEPGVRTQIHVFQLERDRHDGAYSEFQKLDCFATDINELTFMPNSLLHAYVTAGCTDGKVYVWDTAQGDHPIHVLEHDYPLDDFSDDREKEDTGVKFTAWGTSPDRLYTGSSDGVVKVWNVRNRRAPFVRDLLEAPGPISIGAFSPDHAKLAVGDATGRLFLLSVDRRDEHAAHFAALPGSSRCVRRPRPFTPHPEPPPPPTTATTATTATTTAGDKRERVEAAEEKTAAAEGEAEAEAEKEEAETEQQQHPSIAVYARRTYLDSGQLRLHRNPTVGAVQGPHYAATGLFRREAHLAEAPAGPLLAEYERNQRASRDASLGGSTRPRALARRLRRPSAGGNKAGAEAEAAAAAAAARARRREAQHAANRALDVEALRTGSAELWARLVAEGAELAAVEEDWGFAYKEGPAVGVVLEEEEDGDGDGEE